MNLFPEPSKGDWRTTYGKLLEDELLACFQVTEQNDVLFGYQSKYQNTMAKETVDQPHKARKAIKSS